jgi:hypothetical protein
MGRNSDPTRCSFRRHGVTEIKALIRKFAYLSAGLLAVATLPGRVLALNYDQPETLYPRGIHFEVLRNGASVGSHTVSFSKKNDGYLRVQASFNLTIRFLGIPVYKYLYFSEASWERGHLALLTARQDDNGDISQVDIRRDGGDLVIEGPNGFKRASSNLLPTNHWNPNVLSHSSVLNTITGEISDVGIESTGVQTIQAQGVTIQAARHVYSGDIETTVWYDTAGRWVKMMFKAQDGSMIEYLCRECGLGG